MSSFEPSLESPLSGAVVICTRDRASDLDECLRAVERARGGAKVIVLDASTGPQSEEVCLGYESSSSLDLHYVTATRPGLARQRNQAVEVARGLGVNILHFIDDDTEVLPGYFDAIEACFADEDVVVGVGGVIENMELGRFQALKRVFCLWGPNRGTVLPSGRVCNGQDIEVPPGSSVDWLAGGAMSYRLSVFNTYRFDDRLVGLSLGEDYDFGFRVSRGARLTVATDARCIHHASLQNRHSSERVGSEATVLTYAWVQEQRENGMSPALFWWATIGELLMRGVHGMLARNTIELARARGVARGAVEILRGRATRTLPE